MTKEQKFLNANIDGVVNLLNERMAIYTKGMSSDPSMVIDFVVTLCNDLEALKIK